MNQTLNAILAISEVLVILADAYPTMPLSNSILALLTRGNSSVASLSISWPYVTAWTCLLIGFGIRLACYRTLGRMFTFELSVLNDHQLVTSGPYSIVRHPSYTGALIGAWAYIAFHVVQGTYIRSCSPAANTALPQWIFLLWITLSCGMTTALVARTFAEDRMMKAEFGKQWEDWEAKVRWRLLRGIF